MRSENVSFKNLKNVQLSGTLDFPAFPPRAYALFAHCFSCSSRSHAAKRISQALTLHGIATLRFDFTGLGSSGGEFADSHFAANIDDLTAAGRYLAATGDHPAILIGHSLGGAAIIAAAERIAGTAAVVTIGAPFDPAHALHRFDEQSEEIERTGSATVTIGGSPFKITQDFIEASRGHDQARRLSALKKPLLVMHSPADDIVGIDNARLIFEAARHPKSFISLDDSDHLLTNRRDAEHVAAMIATWAERHLPAVARTSVDIE